MEFQLEGEDVQSCTSYRRIGSFVTLTSMVYIYYRWYIQAMWGMQICRYVAFVWYVYNEETARILNKSERCRLQNVRFESKSRNEDSIRTLSRVRDFGSRQRFSVDRLMVWRARRDISICCEHTPWLAISRRRKHVEMNLVDNGQYQPRAFSRSEDRACKIRTWPSGWLWLTNKA